MDIQEIKPSVTVKDNFFKAGYSCKDGIQGTMEEAQRFIPVGVKQRV